MAVISVTITQSSTQVVAGIPKTVSITTNIPATIFYTLDGTDPTLFSTMYTGPIFFPFDQLLVTLKVLATNGTDSSPIVSEVYMTNMVDGNVRLPHAATTAQAGSVIPDSYPFGTPPFQPQQGYLNPADSGTTVNNTALPAISSGFDGKGNPVGFTNQPYDTTNYQIVYTNRDASGNQNANLGNMPGQTTLPYPSDTQIDKGQTSGQGPEQTSQFTSLFDPRAMVIFQDFSQEDPNDPPQINRQFFSLENSERTRDGNMYFNTGQDASAPVSGSFIRAHYNPRTNTITHYYRDSWSNKWIISTAPYNPSGTFDGNMAQTAIGMRNVYEWLPFTRRVLF
jgi:Chitobiase/beta-hexosaminidase C-terminal domain